MQPTTPPTYLRILLLLFVLGAESGQAETPADGAGPLVPYRGYSGAISLSNEQVLIVGGRSLEWEPTRVAEIFDIDAQQFRPAGATRFLYYLPILLTLNDGRILVTGFHFDETDGTEQPDAYSPEVYDPDKNAWSLLDEIQFANHEGVYANKLYDGRILFLAVSDDRFFGSRRKDAQMFRAWLYDSDRESVETLSPLLSPRTGAFPVILPSGDVLVTGGYGAIYQPEHLCDQVPPKYAIEAGEPSGDWCSTHGSWIGVAAPTTEVWNIFWNELTVYDQSPFEGATDLFMQVLDDGDVLVVTRIDKQRKSQKPRSAAVWSIKTEQWTRLDDFPEYYHLDMNNDLLESDDGVLIGPSGGYSPVSGQWKPFPRSLTPGQTMKLPFGAIGYLKTSEPYWTELDPTSAEWIVTQTEQ